MELITDNELSLLVNGHCLPSDAVVASLARELQRYRAAGPLPIELKPGQRWENAAGWSMTIGNLWTDGGLSRADFLAVGDRIELSDDTVESMLATFREGSYRLVAGPGAKP